MMSPEMNAWMTIAMRLMNTHLSPGIDTLRGIKIYQHKKYTRKKFSRIFEHDRKAYEVS